MTAVEIGNLALACCDCNHDCSSNQPSPVPAVTVKLSDYCHFRCWPIRSWVPDAVTPMEIKKRPNCGARPPSASIQTHQGLFPFLLRSENVPEHSRKLRNQSQLLSAAAVATPPGWEPPRHTAIGPSRLLRPRSTDTDVRSTEDEGGRGRRRSHRKRRRAFGF